LSSRPLFLTDAEAAIGPPRAADARRAHALTAVLLPPSLLCALMACAALSTAWLAHIDFSRLFAPYFSASGSVTLLCVGLSAFVWVAQLARRRADDPLRIVAGRLRARMPLLLLPLVVFPLFMVAYTCAKTAIPFLVGYRWEGFWAAGDRMIFGDDAWRIAHRWLGTRWMPAWEWLYTVGWGGALAFTVALVPLNARPRTVAVFYTAMLASWLVGGFLFAYAFSAAGPVFAHLTDPKLGASFTELRQVLDNSLTPNGSIRLTQRYLLDAFDAHIAFKGGGISAFPSMHIATVSIYVMAARRTRWIVPAVLFWTVIFVGSGYFGYHYWVDGLAAAAVAAVCWVLAERIFAERLLPRELEDGAEAPVKVERL
jgi:hypothetical protein